MNRFYTTVTLTETPGGFHLLLDGKPVRVPEGEVILFPNRKLAEAAQAEWEGQGEKIDWATMPCTRFVGGAMTITDEECETIRKTLADYADTDLLCYWSDDVKLQAQQQALWDPVIARIETGFGIKFERVIGIMPMPLASATQARVAAHIASYDALRLVAYGQLVPVLGSFLLALAIEDGQIDAKQAVKLSQLDEAFQAERWGEDAEAREARESKARAIREWVRLVSLAYK